MATLSDLKTRVQTELNRDDLADDLADSLTLSIQQSIDYYAPQRFWFNEKRTTSTMTIGDECVDLPTGLRFIDKVFLVVGNVRYRMVERQMTEIEALYTTPFVVSRLTLRCLAPDQDVADCQPLATRLSGNTSATSRRWITTIPTRPTTGRRRAMT